MITLSTLPDATAEEVFNQSCIHCLNQGKKSLTYDGTCVYFDSTMGSKCAAGCFISPEEYSRDMEMKEWPFLVKNGVVPPDHADLISKLQWIHDEKEVEDWKSEFLGLAKHCGFKTDIIEKFEWNGAKKCYSFNG